MNKLKTTIKPVFISLLGMLALFLAIKPISDNDTWWHLKTGQWILENGRIPNQDIFSFYGIENKLHWTAHEWLSDVVLYQIYSMFGYKGLMFFPLIMLIATLIVMYRTVHKEFSENHVLVSIWMFVAILMLSMFASVRPHMFSFFLFALTIYILNKYLKENSKAVWVLPIISALWVNLHGGSSSLLYALLIMVLFAGIWPWEFGRIQSVKLKLDQIRVLLGVLLVSMITGCINPYGYHMLLYPFENMRDTTMLEAIVEWQSPDLHTPEGLMVFIVVGIALTFVLVSKEKIKILDFLMLAAFAYLTFKSIRQVAYFVIAVTPMIVLHLNLRAKDKEIDLKKNLLNSALIVILISSFTLAISNVAKVDTDTSEYPTIEAVEALDKVKPKRMLNDYNWGGFLIWNGYDVGLRPFIDGRADIFSKYTLEDYQTMLMLKPNWKETFEKYEFDSVVMPKMQSLTTELLKTGEWKVHFEDDSTIILVKIEESSNE